MGVLIDENFSWDYHISELSKKLSRANGIIMKLRHAPQSTLISVYYAIFYSHLNYGCSVWSLTTSYNLDTINVLQKKCIRSINFAPCNSHTTPLFAETKLLKFEDITTATKLKFAFDFKTGNLPDDLKGMFQFGNDVHSYMARCSVKKCLFVPLIQSTSYGIKTLKYSVPVIWNQFSSLNDQINEIKNHMQLNKYFLSRYEIDNNIL